MTAYRPYPSTRTWSPQGCSLVQTFHRSSNYTSFSKTTTTNIKHVHNSFDIALAQKYARKAQTVVCWQSAYSWKKNPPNLRLKRIPVLQQLSENWNKISFSFFFNKNGAAYNKEEVKVTQTLAYSCSKRNAYCLLGCRVFDCFVLFFSQSWDNRYGLLVLKQSINQTYIIHHILN